MYYTIIFEENKCPQHKKIYTKYCSTCDNLFCSKCKMHQKKMHEELNGSDIKDNYQEQKIRLKQYLLSVGEHLVAVMNRRGIFANDFRNGFEGYLPDISDIPQKFVNEVQEITDRLVTDCTELIDTVDKVKILLKTNVDQNELSTPKNNLVELYNSFQKAKAKRAQIEEKLATLQNFAPESEITIFRLFILVISNMLKEFPAEYFTASLILAKEFPKSTSNFRTLFSFSNKDT